MVSVLVTQSVIFASFFLLVERLWPRQKTLKVIHSEVLVNIAYYFLAFLLALGGTDYIRIFFLSKIKNITDYTGIWSAMSGVHQSVSAYPLWLQAICVFVIADFVYYWQHRSIDHRYLRNVHAIHHSAKNMDWLSAARRHPIDTVLRKLVPAIPSLILGFSPLAIAAYAPVFIFFGYLTHANLKWDFGLFRYVLASPAFHQWHHALEFSRTGKNYSGVLPIWDILFKTFYMPKGEYPHTFGVHFYVPNNFIAQLWFPFTKWNLKHPFSQHVGNKQI